MCPLGGALRQRGRQPGSVRPHSFWRMCLDSQTQTALVAQRVPCVLHSLKGSKRQSCLFTFLYFFILLKNAEPHRQL